ncbi:MAG: hypothetical protein ACKO1J_11290, partial [Tagaea sp.]
KSGDWLPRGGSPQSDLDDLGRQPFKRFKFPGILYFRFHSPEISLFADRLRSTSTPLPWRRMPQTANVTTFAALAVALAGRANLLVSGDGDPLTPDEHRGAPIVDPAEALARIEKSTP